MNPHEKPDAGVHEHVASRLLDRLIDAGPVPVLAMSCLEGFSPRMTLMTGVPTLAVARCRLHRARARRFGARQGLSAARLSAAGMVLIVAPTAG